MKMSAMDWIVWVLVFVGALNWGLVGIFDFNLVTAIFGDDSTLTTIVYIVVGLAALWNLVTVFMKSGNSNNPS